MLNIMRSKNTYLILILDVCLVVSAYLLAYLLRFEGKIPPQEWAIIKSTLPYILPFKLIVFIIFGLYKGMWRYTSLVDLFNVLKASATSSTLIILAILFIYRFQGFPRSVFIIDAFLTFIFVGGVRIAIRILLAEKEKGASALFHLNPFAEKQATKPRKRLLIIGAGDSGEKMLREIRGN